jgi:hypothetical protein
MVRSANAHCEEKPLGSLEPNRNNSIIVLDKNAFPKGVETPLTYDVDYKNSFTFTASVRPNECIGCDVAFFSVYPVNDYHMTMIFPANWTWDRVVVTVSDEDNHYKTTVENNTNRKSAFEFAQQTLPAGTHITFLVFPDKNLPIK